MSIIICPNCRSILHQIEKTVRCQNGHSFDLAKQGYINLILANKKKNNNPGDNKIMINAREAFLSVGHYDFLLDSIESAINALRTVPSPQSGKTQLLDVGCGTGYYTRNLFKGQPMNKIGVDISKIGITKAAIMDKKSTYLVGSAFDLAIADNSVHLLLNVFSPIHLEELYRVLKPGGFYIKVIPAQDHMKEVAELVYEQFKPHQSSISSDLESNAMFSIIKTETLKRVIQLKEQDLHNFISMTPYLYKFKEEQLEGLKELSVTISFELIIGQYD